MHLQLSLVLLYMFSVLLLVATPGPVVALIISTSLQAGPRRAMLAALGSNLASLLLALVAVLMLCGSLSVAPHLLSWVSLLGCCFIGYLSVQGLRRLRSQVTPDRSEPARPRRAGGELLKGFVVGISNPKDILFFVSFFPRFIQISPSFNTSVSVLVGLWVIIDFTVLAGYILLSRHALSLKYQRAVSAVSSLVLLAVALSGIAYSAHALLAPPHA